MSGTLDSLVTALGSDVLRAVLLPEPSLAVGGVRIHEPGAAQASARGEILLAVGAHETAAVAALLRTLRGTSAALAVKCRVEDDTEVLGAAAEHGCAVLVLDDGIDWLQAAALIQGTIAEHAEPSEAGEDRTGDLFALADLAATAVGGPVTVEDPRGWLLAYSSDQRGGDAVRTETLMNRRAPADFGRALAARGIPQEVARSDTPVPVRGVGEGAADRLAVGLRAGSFGLGTMWAVADRPDAQQTAAFAQVAQRVAVQLMRRRTEDYRSHRVEMEQLAVLLHGSPAVTGSSDAVELPPGAHWVASLALAPHDPAERAVARSRLEQALALTQRGPELTVHAGQLSNLWYLVLTVARPREPSAELVHSWLRDLLGGMGRDRVPVYAGVGSAADGQGDLPRSRKEAERALAVARLAPEPGEPLAFDDCWARAALIRVLEPAVVADLESVTPLRRLQEQDTAHGTDYVPTLHAWLKHQGNVRAAAEQLHVHTNTLRYRLTKIEEAAGIDLADADVRLVLALQLKALRE
ncbi:helix-turn-helix domain-containing protein [Streptomyces sp. NBC_01275]|uniref:PucR family transcriptional regulator n=1 Tax=Streptomyces sp. NBC_01275 TaxID=2903807 RepID=UPI00225B49A5|nr:PucR family transcriptional regulator [Streptomyces sp. NBC_01275]MCX4766921.1 helix-turn-helix domain-containing protein [Streptomyces sp. NBC_01275]